MTILAMCVNPESGRYVAFCAEDPLVHSDSHGCIEEAVGKLLINHPGLTVDKVVDLEALWGRQ